MRILVPLDGSPFSEAILPTVASIAGPLGAEVELFMVVETSRAHETPARSFYPETTPIATPTGTRLRVPLTHEVRPVAAETREQAVGRAEAEALDYLRTQTDALAGVTTTIQAVISDDPAGAIIARATDRPAELSAMATHGRSGLGHLLMGSVTERVIRSGVAPVLAVRPPARAQD